MEDRAKQCRKQFDKISKKAGKAIFDYEMIQEGDSVALGHHKDDSIQTMLLNMIYHGSISSLPQKLSMFDGRINLIRNTRRNIFHSMDNIYEEYLSDS